MPDRVQATYSGTRAFIDSFSWALRNELKDTGMTMACLMPDAPDTDFFACTDMMDTKLGTQEKDDPQMLRRSVPGS